MGGDGHAAGFVAIGLLLAIAFGVVESSTAAALIVALYLAVLFQTFGRSSGQDGGGPFHSGLRFSSEGNGWKNAVLVIGTQIATAAGVIAALIDGPEAVVVGALGFLGTLVGTPQTIWAVKMASQRWAHDHRDGILNTAFFAPFGVAAIAAVLTCAL
jgi:hypothetical protein